MPSKKSFAAFLLLYLTLRVFSYFFSPDTPLWPAHPVNTAVSAIILLIVAILLIKKDVRGWYIIALEIILGGAGGFFAIAGVALRTWLLAVSLIIFGAQKISNIKYRILNTLPILIIIAWATFSAAHGYFAGHDLRLIISDLIPYLFFLYYFPLKELLSSKSFSLSVFQSSIAAAILGNTLFILFTFIGFTTDIFVLQDTYYHWYRDVALGKITELPFNFYRLVLNEHLLLVPALLYFVHQVIINKTKLLLPTCLAGRRAASRYRLLI
jgi:hypothetical protein